MYFVRIKMNPNGQGERARRMIREKGRGNECKGAGKAEQGKREC